MIDDPVIARLAAANPFPLPVATSAGARPRSGRRRPLLVAGLAAAAVAVPGVAFADDIAGLLGFSTQGRPVVASATDFGRLSGLNAAMQELGFPSTLQLLDERDGISFYAARRADGKLCFAVDSANGKGLGCVLGGPAFPSPERPIIDFSRFSGGARLVGFAADGVASVALLDASGAVIATAPVIDNVYANANPPAGAVAVEALDSSGSVVYRRSFDQAP